MINTITINSATCSAVLAPLWQYDYGQVLKIEGIDLPQSFEVDFATIDQSSSVTMLGEDGQVKVPDDMLDEGVDITAYIYLHSDETDGYTEYVIQIPVLSRPERTEETPTPQEQTLIEQAITVLNHAVEQTGEDVQTAQQAAEDAEAALREFTEVTAIATTLPEGSAATADYDSGVLTFGIPTGPAGQTGPQGPEGPQGPKGDKGDTGVVDASAIWPYLPVDTASGSIASFSDGADGVEVKSLTVDIEPVQSGSGDPSPDNVRPISGWTGANVTAAGKNLLPNKKYQYTTTQVRIGTDGTAGTIYGIHLKPGKYTLTVQSSVSANALCKGYFPATETYTNAISIGTNGGTVTITHEADYNFYLYKSGGLSVNDITSWQLEVGETASAYDPYTGQVIPITWQSEAGTVYGGTLTYVGDGVWTVTSDLGHALYDGSADETWVLNGTLTDVWAAFTIAVSGGASVANTDTVTRCLSDLFAGTSAKDLIDHRNMNTVALISNSRIIVCVPYSTAHTVAEFRAWLASHTVAVCYELATPQTYTLTTEQVVTLLGQNNFWADTGDVSVTYRADIGLYVDKKLAAVVAALS